MPVYQVILIAVSFVAVYISVYHLAGVIRKRGLSASFYFSALAFFIFCYLILIAFYPPPALISKVGMAYLRAQVILMALAGMAWYIYLFRYYQLGWRWMLVVLLILSVVVIAAGLFMPGDLILTGISGLKEGLAGDRPGIVYSGRGFIVWRALVDINITFISLGGLFLILTGTDRLAGFGRLMVIFLLLLLFVAGLNDHLVDYSLIKGVHLVPFTFIAILACAHFLYLSDLRRNKKARYLIFEDSSDWWQVFDRLGLVVVGLDRMGNVFYTNPYLLKITGYSKEEFIGKDWFDIALPPKFTYEVQSAFLEIIERNAHQHYKNPIISKNGEEIDVFWYNVVLFDAQGRLAGTLSIGVDEKNYSRDDSSLENALTQAEELVENIRDEIKKQGKKVI